MTRSGDLLDFGQLFQAFGNTIDLPKSPTFLGNFCKGVKNLSFSSEINFRQLLQTFGDFFLVTLILCHAEDANFFAAFGILLIKIQLLLQLLPSVAAIKGFAELVPECRRVWRTSRTRPCCRQFRTYNPGRRTCSGGTTINLFSYYFRLNRKSVTIVIYNPYSDI